MDIKKFRKKYHMSNADIIRVIQYKYPRFCKYALFMCTNEKEFGVTLNSNAENALMAAVDKKKPNRLKNHQLTVRLDDNTFRYFQQFCEMNKVNTQDAIESAILYYCFDIPTVR